MESYSDNHILNTDFLKYLHAENYEEETSFLNRNKLFKEIDFIDSPLQIKSVKERKNKEMNHHFNCNYPDTNTEFINTNTNKTNKTKVKPERKANPVSKLIRTLLELTKNNIKYIDYNLIHSIILLNKQEYLPFHTYDYYITRINLDLKKRFNIKSNTYNSKSLSNIILKDKEKDKEKVKCCACNNTYCLKMYCICFRNQVECKNCDCEICFNRRNYNSLKQISVLFIEGKNRSKVIRYCKCIKNKCMSNYCLCKRMNIKCGDKCKCVDCYLK